MTQGNNTFQKRASLSLVTLGGLTDYYNFSITALTRKIEIKSCVDNWWPCVILTCYKWVPAAFAASCNHLGRRTKRSHVIRTKKTTTSAKLERPENVETPNYFLGHLRQYWLAKMCDNEMANITKHFRFD